MACVTLVVGLFDLTDGLFFAMFVASCFFSPIFLLIIVVAAVVTGAAITASCFAVEVIVDFTEVVVAVCTLPSLLLPGSNVTVVLGALVRVSCEFPFLILFFGVVLAATDVAVGLFLVRLFGVFLSLAPPRDTFEEFGVLGFSDLGVFS